MSKTQKTIRELNKEELKSVSGGCVLLPGRYKGKGILDFRHRGI